MNVCAVTCTLGFLSKESPPRWPGRFLHGALFERLRKISPETAELAHSLEPRPFSISDIQREGALSSFRCAGLSAPVALAIVEALEVGVELEIGPARARILDVSLDATSYEELYERFVPVDGVHERIPLRLLSPTTFRVGKANMPFPLPRLLWQSWSNRWDAFSSIRLGGFGEWAEEFIVPARFRLKSVAARTGGATLVGAVGECEYLVLRPDSLEARVAAMLAAYSNYCGTGQKTTMGLGMTETAWPARST